MGRTLDQYNKDWPVIRKNIRGLQNVWVHLEKMLQRGASYTHVSDIFYWALVQALLLFGSELWVMSEGTMRMMEGTHVGFLWKIA